MLARDRQIPALRGENDASDGDLAIPGEQGTRCSFPPRCTRDPNVTPENVRQVVQRLETNHVPYELLVFEDEGHGISKPVNQQRLYARLAAFFVEALG